MIAKKYVCDDCGATATFTSYVKARAEHWAVAKDYSKCYCPTCAKGHRKGKATEKNVDVSRFTTGFEQLALDLK